LISTLVFIISSISIEIHDEIEPQRKTYWRPNRRRYYVIEKNSQRFLYRLRRVTKLMTFKSDSENQRNKRHNFNSHHKDNGHHFKSGKGH
jgi:hypothetical protein